MQRLADRETEEAMVNQTERVLLFLHIPKSGGATLNRVLYRNSRDEAVPSIDSEQYYCGVCWFPGSGFLKPQSLEVDENVQRILGQNDIRALLGHFWYGVHRYVRRPWVYSTMLRNPVDRIVSLYHHIRPNAMTLDEFVLHPPVREVDNDQTRRISGIEPEIGACSEAMLRKAKENLRKDFAVVGVTEKFEETVVLLKRKFGWTRDLAQRRFNVSRNNTKADALEPSLRQMILERNELDLRLHEYATALLEEAISREDSAFVDEVNELKTLNAQLPPYTYTD